MTEAEFPGPYVTITFSSSTGHVDKYRLIVTPQGGGANIIKTIQPTPDGSTQSVQIDNLMSGATYTVTIFAIILDADNQEIGSGAYGGAYDGSFKVKAASK